MAQIFISYSRKDSQLVEKIVDTLTDDDIQPWIDWKNIPKGQEVQREIQQAIEESEIFLFFVSYDSIISKWCIDEIEHAAKNSKRILPVVIRDIDQNVLHIEISKRNWIFCREGLDDFNKAIEEIRKTIHTDYEWLKYHTELQVKALRWEQKKDISRLLRGKELREAESQLTKIGEQEDPKPTRLQREYILSSQRAELRAKRQVATGLGLGLMIVVVLAIFAWVQRNVAKINENAKATAQAIAEEQSEISLARSLSSQAQLVNNNKTDANAPLIASLLAIESIRRYPNADGDEVLRLGSNFLLPPYKQISTTNIEEINKIIFSFNGELIASMDREGHAEIWSASTGEEILDLKNGGVLSAMTFGVNSNSFFTSNSHGVVNEWDIASGSKTGIENHGEGHVALDVNLNSKMLITGGADGIISIWDLENRGSVSVLRNGSAIQSVSFTPDGTKIVSVGMDNKLVVWDIFTRKEKFHKSLPPGYVTLNISPDGTRIIIGSEKNGIEVWNISSGEIITNYLMSYNIGGDTGFFSPDSKKIAIYRSYNNKSVIVWDSENEKPITTIDLEFYISMVSFSPDSKYIIIASDDGSIRIWDIEKGREINRILQEGVIYSIAISPNGQLIATAGEDKTIRLWNIPYYGDLSAQLTKDALENYTLDKRGNWIATWSEYTNMIEMLQISTSTFEAPILNTSTILAVDISPNGKYVAASTKDDTMCVWEIVGARKLYCESNVGYVTKLKFNSSSDLIAAADSRVIRIFEIQTGFNIAEFPEEFSINSFVFSSDGQLIAIGAAPDYLIEVWKIANHQKVATFQDNQALVVSDLEFSADGKWLFSGGRDGTARVWDLQAKEEVSRIIYDPNMYFNMQEILKTIPSPDGEKLLTVNTIARFTINNDSLTARESTIRVWDPLSGQEFASFVHKSWVNDILWSPDGNYVFSAGDDGVVRMWDVNSGYEVGRIIHDNPVESLAFTADGSKIISIDYDGVYKVSYWRPTDLITYACTRLVHNLTLSEWKKYFGNVQYQATCPNLPIEP